MSTTRPSIPQQQNWNGDAYVGIGYGLFQGTTADNDRHAHHAIQVVLSKLPVRVWIAGAEWQDVQGVIIGANVVHFIEGSDHPVVLLYVEPDSLYGRALTATLKNSINLLPSDRVLSLMQTMRVTPPDEIVEVICQSLGIEVARQAPALDASVASSLMTLPRPLPEHISAATLASAAGLSVSRFQHRFRAYTGMALRPYLRWLRLLTALEKIGKGWALTDSAAEAGFADAAHFSRTFRRHFGIAPRQLLNLRFADSGQ